jgi:hypothetical protein
MEDIKQALIAKASEKYQNIRPCKGSEDFSDSFTTHNGQLILWFNVEDKSTKIVMSELNPVQM